MIPYSQSGRTSRLAALIVILALLSVTARTVRTESILSAPAGDGPASETADDPRTSGRGWSLVRVDVDVWLEPERGTFRTEGTLALELTGLEESHGPLLLLGTQKTREGKHAIVFRRVEAPAARTEVLPEPLQDRWQQAAVRFEEPLPRGSPPLKVPAAEP